MDHEALTELRSLVVRGDGDGLVAALSQGPWPDDSLQMIGDCLLGSVRSGVDGSTELTRECVGMLRKRAWDGDRELVEVLKGALGTGPTPLLRPLAVDLEELAVILEGDPVHGGGGIDLTSGEVWPQATLDYTEEIGEGGDDDPDRWLWADCEESRNAYQDMVWFIEELDDPNLADRLGRAISGRGAFRRFRNTLSGRPELVTKWYAFSGDRHRGRARSWLAAEGYTPTRPHSTG